MSLRIRIFASSLAVVISLTASVGGGQTAPSRETLEKRVVALEKEVRGLKAELAALRIQIQRSGSRQAPVVPDRASNSDAGRPSEAVIQNCTNHQRRESSIGGMGAIISVQYGTAFASQGGMGEPPKGTMIYPVKIIFERNYERTAHMFVDSFGTWQCEPRN
jgi:hypothetical protein